MTTSVALELFCIVITFLIMVFFMIESAGDDKIDKLFISMLTCNILALVADSLTYMMTGPAYIRTLFIMNTISWGMGFVLYGIFIMYMCEYLSKSAPVSPIYGRIGIVLTTIPLLLLIVNCFTRMYFYIDVTGTYQRSTLFWGNQALIFLIIFYVVVVSAIHSRRLGTHDLVSMLSFVALPAIAAIMQFFIPHVTMIYLGTTLALFVIYSTIHTDYSRRLKEAELNLRQAELNISMSQIQPHFMYNSLTSIAQLCAIDPKRAQKATIDFSNYLRGNLDTIGYKQPIPFATELKHLKTYVSLEMMRFEDRLTVEYDIQTENFMLPAISVQPMVENAIKHGICKKDGGGTVRITTSEDSDYYRVVIEDDGVGFDINAPLSKERSHIGVSNVRDRLESMMNGKLIIESEPGAGTRSTLLIPKNRSDLYQEKG